MASKLAWVGRDYSVIVSGGEIGGGPAGESEALELLQSAVCVVAADSGAVFLHRHGIVPSVLIGDFDSCKPSLVEEFRSRGSKVVVLKRDKDKTDTEAALDVVKDTGIGRVAILGAFGGRRKEHSFANAMLIEPYARKGLDVIVVSGPTTLCALHSSESMCCHKDRRRLQCEEREMYGKPGDWVTLLPVTKKVTGVTTEGLRFPLSGAMLLRGSTLGVSNELVQEKALVAVDQGFLLAIVTERQEG